MYPSSFGVRGLFRRRKPGGLAVVLLVFGIFGCVSAALALGLGTPAAWLNARAAARYPQPRAADLAALPPGTPALLAAQLPVNAATGPHRLALYRVDYQAGPDTSPGILTPEGGGAWALEVPPPEQVALHLEGGDTLTVQLPETVAFANAEVIEEDLGAGALRRYTGFLPGQTLTIAGVWEGEGRATAQTLFAGAPEGYVAYLRAQPGAIFTGGMLCGGASMALLVVAVALRFLGRG